MNSLTPRSLYRAALLAAALLLPAAAQPPAKAPAPVIIENQPDAQRTKQELRELLEKYPSTLREMLAIEPSLLNNTAFVGTYPGIVKFLSEHPDVAQNPSFYIEPPRRQQRNDRERSYEMWHDVVNGIEVFCAFAFAVSVIIWLIRTAIDYRRWSRLAKVQTEVHAKILDRLTSNDDLLAYIQSPPGRRFLESTPIKLDAAPQAVSAPLSRILWSLQGGVVLLAVGIGFQLLSSRFGHTSEAAPLAALGTLALAVGAGFIASAGVSYLISQRMGLLEKPNPERRNEPPAA